MKIFLILAVCIAAATAGVVDHTRCGGAGNFREIRISGCEGASCHTIPGTPYPCEGDLIPSASTPSLSLKVDAIYLGNPITIIDTILENSGVQAGQLYVMRFTITPSDLLSGNTLPVQAEISHTTSGLVEACFTVIVVIR